MAAWNGHLEACKLLLEKGANPNPADRFGLTPLTDAIWGAKASGELIHFLQSHGAKVPSAEITRTRGANHAALLAQIDNSRNFEMAGMSLQVSIITSLLFFPRNGIKSHPKGCQVIG